MVCHGMSCIVLSLFWESLVFEVYFFEFQLPVFFFHSALRLFVPASRSEELLQQRRGAAPRRREEPGCIAGSVSSNLAPLRQRSVSFKHIGLNVRR